jgi:stage II sporulation protein GA (sporulation sigma-E factor processing peptidase)
MVIYLDGVMGLNFLVDWLLLLGVNRLSGFPPGVGRTAAAAAVGGGYAGICLLPGFAFMGSALWRSVSLGIMSMTAFGLDRTALRRGILFVLLSMAMGGMALRMDSGTIPELILCAAGLALLCRLGFHGRIGVRRYHTVRVDYGGKTIRFPALADTGNTLRDPLTGESVLVADCVAARELLGLTQNQLQDPAGTMEEFAQCRFRLIPYQTVGQKGSFLLGLRCDGIQVDGKNRGTLVAFAPVIFGNGDYHGLTGG